MPVTVFTLYPNGLGSVELLGPAGIDYEGLMHPQTCGECSHRDSCLGPGHCQYLTEAEIKEALRDA